MLWRSMLAPLLAVLVFPLFADVASAQPRDRDRDFDRGFDRGTGPGRGDNWQLLGSTRVGGFGADRDVIDVGRREGQFENIALQVRGGAAYIVEVSVIYGNNDAQRIDIRRALKDGERSPPLNLQGRGRAIKSIIILARSMGGPRNRAVVDVYGEERRGRDAWELLGEQSVGFGVDRDTIRVGRHEGRFSKIALEVRDNDVEILDLSVFFNRGPPQSLRVREFIRAGGRTRPIDFAGGDRSIDRIELTYRARPGMRGRAKVAVFGLRDMSPPPPPPPPPMAQWEELGCSKAGFLPDKDVIRVGRREGRFSAIQLRVSRNKVHILNLRVVYERGPPDDIEVRSEIRDGGETRPLDLRGERRAIDRVELVYLAQPSFKGSARVCVFGRP
jgi:hypothetical protein